MNQRGSGLGGIVFGALVAGISGLLVLGSFLLSQAEGPRGLIQIASPTLDETHLTTLFPSPVSRTLTPTASSTPSPTASPSLTATTPATTTAAPTTTGTPACSKTPDDWEPYTVQRNENLNAIADRYGITKEELVEKNCLGSPSIEPGEILYVPAAPPVPTQRPCAPYPGWSYPYQVQVGDTLASIARRTGVSVAQIMHANCMNTDTIRVGKIIFLPGYIPPPPLPTLPVEPTETEPPPPPTEQPTQPPPPTERPTDPPPPTPEPTERPTEPPPPTPEPTERPVPTDLPPTQPPPAP